MDNRLKYLTILFTSSVFCFSFTNRNLIPAWELSNKVEVLNVFEKSMEWFSSNTNCKVDIKYATFKDYTTVKAYDESQGYYKRDKNNIHSLALGVNTIQNEKICLVIDSASNMIVAKNKADLKQPLFDTENFSKLLDNLKVIKKQKGTNGEMTYRLEFRTNELYEATEIIVNTKGLITVVKYYYSKEIKEDEDDPNSYNGKPRMEICFTGYQTNLSFNYDKEFSEKEYVKEDGGKLMPKESYRKYALKDYRFAVK